jgi:sorbitol-specific phosphotransferase system component IIA
LTATPDKPVTISTEGWERLSHIEMAILNTHSGKTYNLNNGKEITLTPEKENTSLLLVVGDTQYINEQQDKLLPDKINIEPNYPNPFNPTTTLQFALPEQAEVHVQVYNILGQQVSTLINNEVREAGVHTVTFDGAQQASGMYFAVFEIGNRRFVQKMTLIK